MPLRLITVPCLEDNYAFLIHNDDTGETALIDAPETAPIQSQLDALGWELTNLLITHHHWDHVQSVDDLRGTARVIGAAADESRLPNLTQSVSGGDQITVCGEPCQIIETYGHTIGHIAFYFPYSGYLFSADSLMAMGCGRLFEGTPDQMWDTMQRLRALPDDTIVCSGHEYTAANMRFALSLEPNNPHLLKRAARISHARDNNQPTVPSTLADEKRTNPFLRADDPALKRAIGMETASDAQSFADIRSRKDSF